MPKNTPNTFKYTSNSSFTTAPLCPAPAKPPSPAELVQAHAQLDRAVDAVYGYKGSKDDAARVAYLFARYSQLVAPLDVQAKTAKPRRK